MLSSLLVSTAVGQPGPAPALGSTVVTPDRVLEFTTNPGSGTVTVRDLLNQEILSQSLVCPEPRGAVLTGDAVSLLVACRGSDEVIFLNTAAFDVTARVRGVGSQPESLRLSPDGSAATALDHDRHEMGIVDIASRRLATRAAQPTQATQPTRATPVITEGVSRDRRGRVTKRPSRPSPAGTSTGAPRSAPAGAAAGTPRPARKNQLVFLGMIHGEHRTSQTYSTRVLRALIASIGPDYVLTEIPPNRLDRAALEFSATGQIWEPRVSRFPEYVDVLFPMVLSSGFEIVGTSAWTQPMDRYRRERLAAIERDPERSAEWAVYQSAIRASEAALARGGAPDDPRWIHTDAYDAAQRIELDVYNRLFDKELGTGGWDTINEAHFANIARVLDEHRGEGIRFLVTYGAGHKSWMLPRLRARSDLEILEVSRFLNDIAPVPPPVRR